MVVASFFPGGEVGHHAEGSVEHTGDGAAVDAALFIDLPGQRGERIGDGLRLVVAGHKTRLHPLIKTVVTQVQIVRGLFLHHAHPRLFIRHTHQLSMPAMFLASFFLP